MIFSIIILIFCFIFMCQLQNIKEEIKEENKNIMIALEYFKDEMKEK